MDNEALVNSLILTAIEKTFGSKREVYEYMFMLDEMHPQLSDDDYETIQFYCMDNLRGRGIKDILGFGR